MRAKLPLGIVAVASLSLTGLAVSTSPATAITRNCSANAPLCIHYNSVGLGWQSEFGAPGFVPSFNPSKTSDPARFKAGTKGGAGAGELVWNNAASFRNLSPYEGVFVYEGSNYTGKKDYFGPNGKGNLANTKNNNASMGWAGDS